MSDTPTPRAGSSSALARMTLALYPPSWRARYGDEVEALLEDSGADLRTVASLAGLLIPAWVWPAQQLHDRPARMRASLAVVLVAWTVLTGLSLVFAQLTQAQGLRPAGHPLVGWSYWIFDGAFLVSVLAVAAGGLPLWLLMIRRAYREHSPRDVAYLLLPLIAPVVYLTVLVDVVSLVAHPHGFGPWWFLVVIVLGFAAGGACAAGPALALRRLHPGGPAVGLAVRAAGVAAVAMGLAGVASSIAAVGLCLWAPHYGGYHQRWPLAAYLPMVLLAIGAAAVSATRGPDAARSAAASR